MTNIVIVDLLNQSFSHSKEFYKLNKQIQVNGLIY